MSGYMTVSKEFRRDAVEGDIVLTTNYHKGLFPSRVKYVGLFKSMNSEEVTIGTKEVNDVIIKNEINFETNEIGFYNILDLRGEWKDFSPDRYMDEVAVGDVVEFQVEGGDGKEYTCIGFHRKKTNSSVVISAKMPVEGITFFQKRKRYSFGKIKKYQILSVSKEESMVETEEKKEGITTEELRKEILVLKNNIRNSNINL